MKGSTHIPGPRRSPTPTRAAGPLRIDLPGARGLELMDAELMYAELGRALADREVRGRAPAATDLPTPWMVSLANCTGANALIGEGKVSRRRRPAERCAEQC